MKRHPALQELSREHHLLLLEARQIRWLRAGDRRAPPADAVLTSFLDTWHSVAPCHIREEEEVLLPLYASYPSPEQERNAARIAAEHAWLRDAVAELEHRIGRETPEVTGTFRSAGHLEATHLLGEIGQRLHDHIRFEERVVFQHLQHVLPAEAMNELGGRLSSTHAARPRT